jgi:glycosyltransferase involved in cell wall biosynthesis
VVTLAVVVCSRDRPQRLRECLPSLVAQQADETLLVDSASTGSTTGAIADELGVRWLRVPEPGLSRARNAAIRATTADVVAFTDDDCIAEPGWAQAIRRRYADSLAGGERLGFVTGRVLAAGEGQPLTVLGDTAPREFGLGDDIGEVGHGANLSVSRSCWEDLGGFDELLGVGATLRAAEDIDFVWRALQRGWLGRYDPGSVVHHAQWRTRRDVLRTQYGYGMGAGALGSKMSRIGGPDAQRAFLASMLRNDARLAASCVRHSYWFGAVQHAWHATGVVTGRWRAGRMPLSDEHLRLR